MSLLRSLMSLVAVVCVAHRGSAEWPCPDDSVIYPCTCTATVSYEMTMDCSNVQSTEDLVSIFETPFSFNDFKRLIIDPVTPAISLDVLPGDVFTHVSFEEVDIINTLIHTVEDETFASSHETLVRLNMRGNEISSFPFEVLDLYVKLQDLDLSYNKLSGILPDIVTEALISLDLSYNTGLMLTQTVFEGSHYLQDLRLNNMGLGDTTPPNVFLTLPYLRTLYMQNNDIPGTLIEDFINTQLQPLTSVHLEGNLISQIHPLSLTGLNDGGTVYFTNNQIQYLYEENWGNLVSRLITADAIDTRGMEAEGTISFRNNLIVYLHREDWEGLVSQFNNANAIDTRDNPLVCGCDLVWLVLNPDLMAIFHAQTMCSGGGYMVDLPIDWFHEHCS